MSSARMEKALHAEWISCSVLQYAAVCCNVLQYAVWRKPYIFCRCCSILQRVAVCCSVLQCILWSSPPMSMHIRTCMYSRVPECTYGYSLPCVFEGPVFGGVSSVKDPSEKGLQKCRSLYTDICDISNIFNIWSHVTHTKESCHTYEGVMSHIRRCHVFDISNIEYKYWIYHCIKESSVWRSFFCKRDP